MNLFQASRQWATRPADSRFWNLQELEEFLSDRRTRQGENLIDYSNMTLVESEGDENIKLQLPNGANATLNNWSFKQLCDRLGVPASLFGNLSRKATLAVLRDRLCSALQSITNGITAKPEVDEWDVTGEDNGSVIDLDQMKLLRYKDENGNTDIEAITSSSYARKFDLEIVRTLRKFEPAGWRNPPARPNGNVNFGRTRLATKEDVLQNQSSGGGGLNIKEGDLLAPAGLYRGIEDLFIFMVNDKQVLEGGLKRGFFLSNSEVGKASKLRALFFLYESVCGNHIVWQVSGVNKVERVHKKSSMKNFDEELAQQLDVYSKAPLVEESYIARAKKAVIAKNKDEVIEVLYEKRSKIGGQAVSKKLLEKAFDSAVQWEHTSGCAPVTAWGFVHGFTRVSQLTAFADKRATLDGIGGKILDMYVPDSSLPTTANVPASL